MDIIKASRARQADRSYNGEELCEEERVEGDFFSIAVRLGKSIDQLSEVNAILEEISNRVYGESPECNEVCGISGAGAGDIGIVNGELDRLHKEIGRARAAAARFERL